MSTFPIEAGAGSNDCETKEHLRNFGRLKLVAERDVRKLEMLHLSKRIRGEKTKTSWSGSIRSAGFKEAFACSAF
jgi:hypothetical protein